MSGEIVPYADKIVDMIEQARQNALRSVNAELIKLYWNVGKYLSEESVKSSWGDAFINETAFGADFRRSIHPLNLFLTDCPDV